MKFGWHYCFFFQINSGIEAPVPAPASLSLLLVLANMQSMPPQSKLLHHLLEFG